MSKILVIDDSASVLALLSEILREVGHQVMTAASGRLGLQALRETPVDLVVTDMYMPDGDGIEIMFEARKAYPELPLIVMSAKSGALSMFPAAKALGAVSTLQKPFSKGELNEAVTAALAGAALRNRSPRSVKPAAHNP